MPEHFEMGELGVTLYTHQLLRQVVDAGLIQEFGKDGDYPFIKHADGDQITFDTGDADLRTYLEGMLKAWELIRCGIVKVD